MDTSLFPLKTPEPPYYAAIFTSVRSHDEQGYAETDERMVELADFERG